MMHNAKATLQALQISNKTDYDGESTVDGDCDGVPLSLNVTNTQVDVPIASVKRFVKSGNDVAFWAGGGCIANRDCKERGRFVDFGGVSFLKARVRAEQSQLGFARPVRKRTFHFVSAP